jgi:hypothetical protein
MHKRRTASIVTYHAHNDVLFDASDFFEKPKYISHSHISYIIVHYYSKSYHLSIFFFVSSGLLNTPSSSKHNDEIQITFHQVAPTSAKTITL